MKAMQDAGVNPFAYTYAPTHKATELQTLAVHLKDGEEDAASDVAVAGRIMLRRVFGKLAFFTLQDESGQIQLYLEKGRLGDAFETVKDWTDVSDIIGARGTLKRTDKGELSVYVKEWTMLTKSLLPLPDKFKGLTDRDKRYRQRHLDMIVNPEVKRRLSSPCGRWLFDPSGLPSPPLVPSTRAPPTTPPYPPPDPLGVSPHIHRVP